MIALVRNVQIPCRYVSGYLYHSEDSIVRSTAQRMPGWKLCCPAWDGLDSTRPTI